MSKVRDKRQKWVNWRLKLKHAYVAMAITQDFVYYMTELPAEDGTAGQGQAHGVGPEGVRPLLSVSSQNNSWKCCWGKDLTRFWETHNNLPQVSVISQFVKLEYEIRASSNKINRSSFQTRFFINPLLKKIKENCKQIH